jgi:hypothetical protein
MGTVSAEHPRRRRGAGPGPEAPPEATETSELPVPNTEALLIRPGNRAVYLGQDEAHAYWRIDTVVQPEDDIEVEHTDPASGRRTWRRPAPGEVLERHAEVRSARGPGSYDAVAALAWSELELRAAEGKTGELVALLREAAADERWSLTTSGGRTIVPAARGRAFLRALADAVERDGRGALSVRESAGEYQVGGQEGRDGRRPRPRLPEVPNAFAGEQALVPSAFPVQGVIASFHNAREGEGGWPETADGRPYYPFEQPQGRVTIELRPTGGAAVDEAARTALWAQVKQLGDIDGDVVFAALAQWMHPQHRDPQGLTWITSSAILDYRGIKPKTKAEGRKRYRAGHRRQDLVEIAACWDRLRLLYLDLRQVEVMEERPGKRPKKTQYALQTEFIHVPERVTQDLLDGSQLPVAWRYRPGRWIDRYLQKPNLQMAVLMQRSLEYDPYRERWEKRLSRYFLFHLRISEGDAGGQPLRRRVGPVLQELHLDEWLDRRHPERTVRRFEKAMNRLRDDGQIGGWGYTPEARAKVEQLPSRGWLDEWLAQAAIAVDAPPVAQARYARLAQRARLADERARALLAQHRGAGPAADATG